ncbi:MAG: hypothetical protein COW03_17615 [Cytophagales bacterium CG12_big_fil_rev_8_21_14_0_65_40_12]|nr:MAG: hypothetical protein COW03_17615 [Cytophagales bacterium CG12_big_fil_rev_8_21_14_0_65_40_12]PIW06146.1 MAG: hypothetical protein COW40_01030 [Cytophagales bacterium CG17_big_fil_post_rev_8_21_14_2_50_40_13]
MLLSKKVSTNMIIEKLTQARAFFNQDVPLYIAEINEQHQPIWGIMTPHHMLEHLIVTFKLSLGRIQIPVVTPADKLEKRKAYLINDSPMLRSVPSPTGNNELQPLRTSSLEEAKQKLLKEIESYLVFVEAEPSFVSNHPYGGPMTAQEWLLFHKKHFIHHFTQFGIIPENE